jgi:site-specific recombinase XerD
VNTVRAYAFALVSLLRWLCSCGVAFKDLEEHDLVGFVAHLRDRDQKPASINHRLAVIRSFHHFLTGKSFNRDNAFYAQPSAFMSGSYDRQLGLHWVKPSKERVLRVRVPQTLVEPLTTDQVRELLRSCRRYRDLALVSMMLFCGLRSAEVLNLQLSDIDVDNYYARLRGKGNKERLVPIPDPTATPLAAYLRLERPRFCLTDRVFVALQGPRTGRPMTSSGLRSLFRHRRRQSRLVNANPHSARHTFATEMARAGVSVAVLQRLLGHVHVETTMRYINLSLEDVAESHRQAVDAIHKRYLP